MIEYIRIFQLNIFIVCANAGNHSTYVILLVSSKSLKITATDCIYILYNIIHIHVV